MGVGGPTLILLSILSSLFHNMSFPDCIHSTNQNTSRRTKLAHKEQSQAGPRTSVPTKECLEDHAKTHS